MKRMNIGLNITKDFVKYSYVLLMSIFENNRDYEVNVYIFSGNIEENDLAEMKKMAAIYDGNIILLTLKPNVISEIFKNPLPQHPIYMHTVYFMFQLLPNDVDRILVLDADMVVKKSLGELYETDFDDNYCICSNANCASEKNSFFQAFKEMKTDLFTAACVLYNVSKIVKDFTFDDIADADAKVNEIFGRSSEEFGFALLFKGKIKYVSEHKYGFYILPSTIYKFLGMTVQEMKKMYDDVVVIHYHCAHPWVVSMVPTQKYWWEYAKKTPYYDEFHQQLLENEIINYEIELQKLASEEFLIDVFENLFSKYVDKKIVLYGTGQKTQLLLRKLANYNFVGIIDNDPQKIGLCLNGVNVIDKESLPSDTDVIIVTARPKYFKEISTRIYQDEILSKFSVYFLDGRQVC